EALERLELAFVNDDVVAYEADAGTTFDLAFDYTATRDLADLGDVEHLVDDVKAAMSGLLSPERRETFIGNAEILE
ncbi:hypothetical protein, partial [Rhizobium leguminosarum]|uniref:hypothetical protein n=1 Tax=Rhizobium leguminosarum TaxID=384 RepID=UPI003F9DA6E7